MREHRYSLVLFACLILGCGASKPKSEDAVVEKTTTEETPDVVDEAPSEVISENDVAFKSRGVELRGSVFRPDTTETVTGVLIVHDWGPWGRDGTVQDGFGVRLPVEAQIYRGIAESLAENGFLTLSYDKRSCVINATPWCTYEREFVDGERNTLEEAFMEDARAALEVLASQPGVDKNSLLIVSHGHGGEIAMELAADPRVKGVALLVPHAEPPDKVAQFQTQQSIEWIDRELKSGDDNRMKDLLRQEKRKLEKNLKAQKKTFAALRNGNTAEMAFGLPGKAWQQFFKSHDRFLASLKDAKTSTVVVTGGNVSSEKPSHSTFEKIAGGNERVAHIHIDDLCQLLVKPQSEKPTTVPDEVIEAILSVQLGN